ncbi:MAG TPA: hypothetical protein VL461_11730 [Dictyobacter sp.]|jgi:hypothetical protein|nr:hypothetical protein [Dictyobacter sp.]
MKRIFSFGFAALVLAVVALVLPTASAGTAHAAMVTPQTDTTHCASLGSLIESDKIYAGSTLLGYLNIYYNSSNGYNCAETTSASATYGVSKFMFVDLFVCKQTSASSNCDLLGTSKPYDDTDSGSYAYYAGPVGVYGKGHCIGASAQIEGAAINTGGASHCG